METEPCGNPDSINSLLHATKEGLTRPSTITPAWLARSRPIVIGDLPGARPRIGLQYGVTQDLVDQICTSSNPRRRDQRQRRPAAPVERQP